MVWYCKSRGGPYRRRKWCIWSGSTVATMACSYSRETLLEVIADGHVEED